MRLALTIFGAALALTSARDPYASLPASLRTVVVRRGCKPPQRRDADSAAVALGAFFMPPARTQQRDWAIVCIHGTEREILVFRGGQPAPTALTLWAQRVHVAIDSGTEICDGSIARVSGADIASQIGAGQLTTGEDSLTTAERGAPAHDGIVDGDCDGVSVVHYWTGRRWVLLPGSD
jgi:hypothetical protein